MTSSNLVALRADLAADHLALDDYVSGLETTINEKEGRIRALVDEEARVERLRRDSRDLTRRYPDTHTRPPLFGAAIGVKDIFAVDGLETRAGSDLPPEHFSSPEATSVRRLKAAGALILGKTVTTEFAFADPGPTANPRDPARTPGGSSSGSAAAVAAGYTPVALGSQTVDSVINPAAYCGVVGFKPGYGRVPIDGCLPLSPSMDHVGWLASDVAGTALLGSVLFDRWDPVVVTEAPRVAIPVGPYLEQTEPEALAQFSLQIAALEDGGVEVKQVPVFDDIALIAAAHRALIAAEFALGHRARFRDYGTLYHPKSAALFAEGSPLRPETIAEGLRSSQRVSGSVVAAMEDHGIDLWAAPAATGAAPQGLDYIGDPAMSVPWTHAHLPSVTVPAGTVDGMPLGLQLIGRPGADEYLLAATGLIQRRL